jgi:hypothetical protein
MYEQTNLKNQPILGMSFVKEKWQKSYAAGHYI